MEGPLAAYKAKQPCCPVNSRPRLGCLPLTRRFAPGLQPLVLVPFTGDSSRETDPEKTHLQVQIYLQLHHISCQSTHAMAAPMTLLHYEGVPYAQGVPSAQQRPKVLGTGSMGTVPVYLYVDTTSGEQVAIKRISIADLHPTTAGDLLHHLPRELRTQYELNHPLIVKLKDVILTPDHLYLVLELAEAGDLFRHTDKNLQLMHVPGSAGPHYKSIGEANARWFFQQLIAALDYLHAKGVSHRDLKLENILLKSTGTPHRPCVKLCDYSLSRFGVTANTAGLGTLEYTAPEAVDTAFEAANNPLYDPRRADIWSVGVVLYVMLMGQYPFPSTLLTEERLKLMAARPLQLPGYLSQECVGLLEALLHPNPEERITLEGIKQHPWVQRDLPAGAFDITARYLPRPPVCAKTREELDSIIARVTEQLQAQAW